MKIIITDCDHENIAIEMQVATENGLKLRLEQCRTENEVIERCGDGAAFINQYAPITRRVMEALPNLLFVVRYGVGVDNVDLAAAAELGVQVCNVPDYGMNEVADQALTFFMALARKLVPMDRYTKTQKWDYRKAIPIHRLSSMTVGLVGIGRIGGNFAAKVHALGCKVIACDLDPAAFERPALAFIERATLDEVLTRSDAVALFLPLDNAKNLIDAAALARMKPSAFLINTSRGGIVNEADLDAALEKGVIAGAGFDVMACEPATPDSPLFRHENFLCTPHMAWYSEEAAKELKQKAAEEACGYALGGTCRYPVNTPPHPRWQAAKEGNDGR